MHGELAGVLFDLGGTLIDYDGSDGGLEVLYSACRAVYRMAIFNGYRGELASLQERFLRLDALLWEEAKAGRRALTLEAELVELFQRSP